MTKGPNSWRLKMKSMTFERLSVEATEYNQLLAAVTAWLIEQGIVVSRGPLGTALLVNGMVTDRYGRSGLVHRRDLHDRCVSIQGRQDDRQ